MRVRPCASSRSSAFRLLPGDHSACEERGVRGRMALPSACRSAGEAAGDCQKVSVGEAVTFA